MSTQLNLDLPEKNCYFVLDKHGNRTADGFSTRHSTSEEFKRWKDKQAGKIIDGPRACPYPGCTGSADARPPCGLCYE